MKLKELICDLDFTMINGSEDMEITDLCYDSRKAEPGSVFVCISGTNIDGHDFAEEVVSKGAVCLVVERKLDNIQTPQVLVENSRYALALMSQAYFGYPARELKTIGITGTKGKTTTTYMVKSILDSTGLKTGLIGTIETIIGDEHIPALNTTPESYVIQETFRKMADAGIGYVVMEVSSQGLMLSRVAGIEFDLGIFTNLESDHIGPTEHKDMDDYIRCKAMLFSQCKTGILNGDDAHLEKILKGHTCEVKTFGLGEGMNYRATDLHLYRNAGVLGIKYHVSGDCDFDVTVDIPGRFSVYNSLTAIAICDQFDIPKEKIQAGLADIKVRGRVEMVPVSDHFTIMVDYAHNAMALESLLRTLREYNPGRLITVFGCGGNRSKVRRYEMGEVSSKLADLSIVTSDNPRFEEPDDIIDDIMIGINKGPGEYVRIADRKEAIRYAMVNAMEGDVIIVAGKGHEDYQEIKGIKHHMDDRENIIAIAREEKIQ